MWTETGIQQPTCLGGAWVSIWPCSAWALARPFLSGGHMAGQCGQLPTQRAAGRIVPGGAAVDFSKPTLDFVHSALAVCGPWGGCTGPAYRSDCKERRKRKTAFQEQSYTHASAVPGGPSTQAVHRPSLWHTHMGYMRTEGAHNHPHTACQPTHGVPTHTGNPEQSMPQTGLQGPRRDAWISQEYTTHVHTMCSPRLPWQVDTGVSQGCVPLTTSSQPPVRVRVTDVSNADPPCSWEKWTLKSVFSLSSQQQQQPVHHHPPPPRPSIITPGLGSGKKGVISTTMVGLHPLKPLFAVT